MRRLIETSLAAAAFLALSACGGGDSGAPTAEEDRELNNAAAMLDTEDASADSLTVQDPALGNGDAPAQAGELPVDGGDAANGAASNAQ